jgi:hypothetical protein
MAKKHKCKICRSEYEKFTTTQQVCSPPCAIEFAKRKEQKRKDDEFKQLRREHFKNDRSYQTRGAVYACNAYILLRDTNDGCISCGTRSAKFNAGHYKSAGAHPALRFHWANIHKQCVQCNKDFSGNIIAYRPRLIEKVGIEMVEWLELDHPPQHRSVEDLREIAEWFRHLKRTLSVSGGL